MMSLAFVQPDLCAALHVGIEQPVDDKERALDTSDFAQGQGQLVLSGIGSELPQQLARGHDARDHGGSAAQDVGPVCRDEGFLDLAADQPLQLFGAGCRVEEIEALQWQVPDAGDELEAQEGCYREDMVGEAARVGILLADILARARHQQAIQNVGSFVHRGRDGLGGEGAELVGHMGVGLQPGLLAVFGVDEVHRLALSCRREELPITRCRLSGTPEPCHRQRGLRLDHLCQCARHGLAFDMPSRQAGELEVVMGVGSPCHLAEAEVQSLGKQHVQEADPVLARHTRMQMREGFGEPDLVIHFQQEIRDPDFRQALVEVEDHGFGFFGNSGGQAVDLQHTIFDRPARNGPGLCSPRQATQGVGHSCLAVGEPDIGLKRHG